MTAIKTALSDRPETLWWSDIGQARLCFAELLTDAEARAELASWRRRLAEVAGPARYALYLTTASNLSDPGTTTQLVRADLAECIAAVYYFYAAYGIAARSRSNVTKSLMGVALCVLGIEAIFALLLTLHRAPGKPVIAFQPEYVRTVLEYAIGMSAAAVVGSVISVQRRLQDPRGEVDPMYRYIQTTADWFSTAFVSPIFAAIFGVVMYGLLASKLLSSTLLNFDSMYLPAKGSDVAILLVLGFAAGFAEQLVPDALTRIASRALGSGANNASANSSQPMAPPADGASEGGQPTQTSVVPPPSALGQSAFRLATALPLTRAAASLGQDSTLASEPRVEPQGATEAIDAHS